MARMNIPQQIQHYREERPDVRLRDIKVMTKAMLIEYVEDQQA
jgi:hypothetical protein